MSNSEPGSDDLGTRRRAVLIGAVLAVLALVVGVVVLTTRDGGQQSGSPAVQDPSAPPSLTAAPTTDPSATGGATGGTTGGGSSDGPTQGDAGDEGTPGAGGAPGQTLAPVPFSDEGDYGDGVSARVVASDAVRADGNGPGDVDGPAVAFTVELVNGTGRPLEVDRATVNAYYGADDMPASPVESDRRNQPFTGPIAPGDSARGVYLFSVPRDARGAVRLEVSHAAVSTVVAFEGPAGR